MLSLPAEYRPAGEIPAAETGRTTAELRSEMKSDRDPGNENRFRDLCVFPLFPTVDSVFRCDTMKEEEGETCEK